MKSGLLSQLWTRYKLLIGILLGFVLVAGFKKGLDYTSTNEFCELCHVHPHATTSWKQGAHHDTESGVVVHCVECHLPPGGFQYVYHKALTGIRDAYGTVFKDSSELNWEEMSKLRSAVHHTYKASCLRCHQNLFSKGLSTKGEDAHLYYMQKENELRCLNCHLKVGHYHEEPEEGLLVEEAEEKILYTKPANVTEFENFTEFIPGTSVSFEMIAIPGGSFKIGSPPSEPFRESDEGPQQAVELSPFWMGKVEITWSEYEAFYRQTATEGRTDTRLAYAGETGTLDAITGPTPAYGNPDQGWGTGQRPAITMTHHAAMTYCKWLSRVTGKTYRLPTEAEWEYASRGGTEGPYFFEGSPKAFSEKGWWNSIFGADTTTINSYVIYKANSQGKTHVPHAVQPNPYGLINMLGNVREFCLDWYDPSAYQNFSRKNPMGPETGTEHVVRGGSFYSDASDVRCADRDYTRHDAWMMTDPQIPKSLWWYSDCHDVGFRVVCEYEKK
jgi:cytochrome c nitrite reductase small subunit